MDHSLPSSGFADLQIFSEFSRESAADKDKIFSVVGTKP
jgi:hypothetical protein